MRKRISTTSGIAALSVLAMLAFATIAYAAKPTPIPAAVNGLEHPGQASQLYLYEKDSSWIIVPGGAWGKFNFKISGTGAETKVSGVFNGHGLVPGENYTLIYYPEPAPNPWPAGGWQIFILGNGMANNGGNVHITAGDTIIDAPDNQPDQRQGDKIWLVLSSDLTDSTISGWHPDKYLFEYDLINKP